MNNITDHDWEYKGIDGAIKNDWYIIPLVVLGTIIAFVAFAGIENTFNVLVTFFTSI